MSGLGAASWYRWAKLESRFPLNFSFKTITCDFLSAKIAVICIFIHL